MRRRIAVLLMLVSLASARPSEAGLFGSWLERLSGPGPFVGIGGLLIPITCFGIPTVQVTKNGETWFELKGTNGIPDVPENVVTRRLWDNLYLLQPTTDAGSPGGEQRSRVLAASAVRPQLHSDRNCRNASRPLERVALNWDSQLLFSIANELDDDPDRDGRIGRVWGSHNVLALDYHVNRSVSIGFGGGAIFFWGSGFDLFVVPVLQPVRFSFRPLLLFKAEQMSVARNDAPDGATEVRRRRLEVLEFRVAPNWMLRSLSGSNFGATDDGFQEELEWAWSAAIFLNISALFPFEQASAPANATAGR